MAIRILTLGMCLAAALTTPACRAKVDTAGYRSPRSPGLPAAAPAATSTTPGLPAPATDATTAAPSPDAMPMTTLTSRRTFFQTREVITFMIDRSLVAGGSGFRLLNTTRTPRDLDKAAVVAQGELKTGSYGAFDITAVDDRLVLSLYPGAGGWEGRLFYGRNILKLFVDNEDQPVYATEEINLADFAAFGAMASSLVVAADDLAEGDGYRLQGWTNALTRATVSDGEQVLTSGLLDMVHP